jgi:hypothetical protein
MKSKVIKAKNELQAEMAEKQVMISVVNKAQTKGTTVIERVAASDFYQRYYYFDVLKKAFPFAKDMHYVERFYPHSPHGLLAIDESNYLSDIETMKLKKKHLAEAGIKYILLNPSMTEEEALEQLA